MSTPIYKRFPNNPDKSYWAIELSETVEAIEAANPVLLTLKEKNPSLYETNLREFKGDEVEETPTRSGLKAVSLRQKEFNAITAHNRDAKRAYVLALVGDVDATEEGLESFRADADVSTPELLKLIVAAEEEEGSTFTVPAKLKTFLEEKVEEGKVAAAARIAKAEAKKSADKSK